MQLTTPALLFPAISLLFLAYTNRFLALAQLVRSLHHSATPERLDVTRRQIANLQKRIRLIRLMQMWGVIAFVLCAVAMTLVFLQVPHLGELVFGASLNALVLSLLISLYEVTISTKALEIELEDLRHDPSVELGTVPPAP